MAASYYFYACWNVYYLSLIVFSTLIDYFCAIKIEENRSSKNWFLILSLVTNLGLLFSFKYFNFLAGSFNQIFDWDITLLKVLLPVGISFYTFQSLSYTIDVYRGHKSAEKHFGIFALYVSFFPQLVAGPIERSTHLLPQFFQKHELETKRVISGLRLIILGIFKKIVIADYMAILANITFLPQAAPVGLFSLLGVYCFAIQIYCDFSGYSDIAIGSSRILGFDLMENFRAPYFAKSIKEFWQRWHISLSTWFRDYLYLPLGGNRVGKIQWAFNIFMVFFISGLWHGANWTFMIWGAIHGIFYLLGEAFTKLFKLKASKNIFTSFIKQIFTFHIVCLAWIFFRAQDLQHAWIYLMSIISDPVNQIFKATKIFSTVAEGIFIKQKFDFKIALVLVISLFIIDFVNKRLKPEAKFTELVFNLSSCLAIIMIILFYNFADSEFIYFQF